jgi:oligosaccharide reducing-end xylanase
MTTGQMKKISLLTFIIANVLILSAFIPNNPPKDPNYPEKTLSQKSDISKDLNSEDVGKKGAYFSGKYPNLFINLLRKSKIQVKEKINNAFNQLYYGNDTNQRVYYPVEPDMAYIKDINNNDVRTEGMSYGMMIAAQLNKKSEFDRLWKWAKTYMQHQTGPRKNYFAWHNRTNGEIIDSNSASDGEEWFVMDLFFASARWGNGEGIFNYRNEAQKILNAMLGKSNSSNDSNAITNMFNKKEKMVVFVPQGRAADFTDPSYHLPHFYELWGRWANNNNRFWCEAASISRKFLKRTVNSRTGLAPDYANFDGTALNWFGRGNNDFRFDAWRVAMNIAIDYEWFAKDEWEITQSNKLLNFFYNQGLNRYGNQYTLQGKELGIDHSTGLVAMNAVAALAATSDKRVDFVEQLWNAEIPHGLYRYYDGMLYMLGLLQVSGNFKIYNLLDHTIPNCTE